MRKPKVAYRVGYSPTDVKRKDLMPHLPKSEKAVIAGDPRDPGELTFVLYQACLDYIGLAPRYADFCEAIGSLECAKLELYRLRVAPYEDTKIAENGEALSSAEERARP